MEILQKEGINVSEISPRRRVNGERITICLKDVKDNKIYEIIDKYKLDSNLKIGQQILVMRKNIDKFDEVERNRILNLGIKKHDKPLDQKSRPFRNQIEEALYILEELKEEGIDVSSADKDVILEDGSTRKRYLYEIEDENISDAIKKLNIPQYTLIGKRMEQVQNDIHNELREPEFKNDIKERLVKLGFRKYRDEVSINKTLQIIKELENQGINVAAISTSIGKEQRKTLLEDVDIDNIDEFTTKLGVKSNFPLGKGINKLSIIYRDGTYKNREDLTSEQLQDITEEYELDKDFAIGNRIINIKQAYKGKSRIALSEDEKKEIEEIGLVSAKKIEEQKDMNATRKCS